MRLVVVDNDAAVIELLTLDLRLEGHDIAATAADADAAIRACAEYDPEVVVVDLKLGKGPDGIEVARQVARPGRRIILHTNYVSADVIKRAEAVGAVVVEKGNLRALRRAVVS
ncbi:MAG TPA: response regulator [Acidimicrobiales bacterium]|jgi:CheY-like chemotaxis protein|nr:response regulator [Acidimicrobiales bacterium]